MAEQLKVTIKLKANPSSAAPPIISAPKAPFDPRKISGAIVLTLGLLASLIYFMPPLTAQSLETNTSSPEQTESAAVPAPINQLSASELDGGNGMPPASSAQSSNSAAPTTKQIDPSGNQAQTLQPVQAAEQDKSDMLLPEPAPQTPASMATPERPASTNQRANNGSSSLDALVAPAAPGGQSNAVDTHKTSWLNHHLVRAQLTSGIQSREPQDELEGLELSQLNKLYLFVELQQMQGQTIEVRWYKQQQLQASVELAIGGPRWRTYASKLFDSRSRGQWRVAIFQQQQLIFEQYFTVQ